jgi:hypothetical protein
MLSNQQFYYRTIRRCVSAFGTLFKDILILKYTNDGTFTELDRHRVGLSYGGKEAFLTRLQGAPDLPAPIQVKLPTMSFELNTIRYDASRKLQSQIQNFQKVSGNNSSVYNQYTGVPYNLNFNVQIYVRNIEDGLQIIEQILPYFNPDYTLTMDFVDGMSISKNVPIILDSIDLNSEYQGSMAEEVRIVIWTLNFTMQTYLFGPTYTGGIIKQATANTFYYGGAYDTTALVLSTANTPRGNFTLGEAVYQGHDITSANAIGVVANWNYAGGQLAVSSIQGQFKANANAKGALSGASVKVNTVPADVKLVSIVTTPVPNTANIGDDFGFLTTITEFPNIT